MITNTGKKIIAKYMVGQTTSYASHIAFGCGAVPLDQTEPYGDYSDYKSLKFEMFRAPIVSRGFITDQAGTNFVVLTAELPSEERYEITEMGLYPAASNSLAKSSDSRILVPFSNSENWQVYNGVDSLASITQVDDSFESENIIRDPNSQSPVPYIFQSNASNVGFSNNLRVARLERPRFLDNSILVAGNSCKIGSDFAITNAVATDPMYVYLDGTTVNLSQNSTDDLIKVAFSVLSKDATSTSNPDSVRLIIEFATSNGPSAQTAQIQIEVDTVTSDNRYFVIEKKISELVKTNSFSWRDVSTIKIYASAIVGTSASNDFYIALDAIRLDNISTLNPLYGLSAYSVIKNGTPKGTGIGAPVIKNKNSSNLVEFRFALGVG